MIVNAGARRLALTNLLGRGLVRLVVESKNIVSLLDLLVHGNALGRRRAGTVLCIPIPLDVGQAVLLLEVSVERAVGF